MGRGGGGGVYSHLCVRGRLPSSGVSETWRPKTVDLLRLGDWSGDGDFVVINRGLGGEGELGG